jgi:uncharacterized FAD-dependent dehydrogenase
MIRFRDITLPFDHGPEALAESIRRKLRLEAADAMEFTVVRKSVDARRKDRIVCVYTVDVLVNDEDDRLAALEGDSYVSKAQSGEYIPPQGHFDGPVPVVVGSGPCGLFAALMLARLGARPILVERGKDVASRLRDVQAFWQGGVLSPESNVQFGEGGAGTFSDGKLVTQIKDKQHRIRKVLQEFVAAGAPEEILYLARPHIGTDKLVGVVRHLRQTILDLGGQVRFETKLTGLVLRNGRVTGAVVNGTETIETGCVVLALGHSARDTFEMLHAAGVPIEAKPFSIGVRIEHPQMLIDKAQYGRFAGHLALGAADYKLVHHGQSGRSAYTFCMCPGGEVIACSSEPGGVVTNGMSRYARSGPNANSALLVGVGPEDFAADHPLAGIAFQRTWERKAFEAADGDYAAPIQLVGDFLEARASRSTGQVQPSYTPAVTPCDLRQCLPEFVAKTLKEAIGQLDKKLHGFAMYDAVMTAVESRSSSPIRILRDETYQSPTVNGLYPAGEGAGYAGGITSSAVDGIKAVEAICENKRMNR